MQDPPIVQRWGRARARAVQAEPHRSWARAQAQRRTPSSRYPRVETNMRLSLRRSRDPTRRGRRVAPLLIALLATFALASSDAPGANRPRHISCGVSCSMNAMTSATSYRTYRLRWPSSAGQAVTYHLRFNSRRIRTMSLRIYGITVPRGFGFSFIVACEHRGPAVLSWNWSQMGRAVHIQVKMTTGRCFRPGVQVAGTSAAVNFRVVT
jgi:hypothetical protein